MNPPDQQPPLAESQQNDPRRAAILNKLDVAWGSNVGDQGFADPNEVAERAYDALWQPDVLVSGMDERARAAGIAEDRLPSGKLRAKTLDALKAPLELVAEPPLERSLSKP